MGFARCCVPNCRNTSKTINMHHLPLHNKELLRIWITRINNTRLFGLDKAQLRHIQICDCHFSDEYRAPVKFHNRSGLKKNSVPTLLLPEYNPKEKTIVQENELSNDNGKLMVGEMLDGDAEEFAINDDEQELENDDSNSSILVLEVIDDEEEEGSITATYNINTEPDANTAEDSRESLDGNQPELPTLDLKRYINNNFNKNRDLSKRARLIKMVGDSNPAQVAPKPIRLNKLINILREEVQKYKPETLSFCDRLNCSEQYAMSSLYKTAMGCLNQSKFNFILSHMQPQNANTEDLYFTLKEKILTLSLMKKAGRGYELLSILFSLPSKEELFAIINNLELHPEINTVITKSIKPALGKLIDKNCYIEFEDIPIDDKYSVSKLVMTTTGARRVFKSHVMVFFAKGHQWKQLVGFKTSSSQVETMRTSIMEVMDCVTDLGLIVNKCAYGIA